MGKKFLFALSLIFIFSGGFNYGFSRFWPSLPFIALALWISTKSFKSVSLTTAVLILTTFSIAFNLTLEKNPFIFPILDGGEIQMEKDGYLKIFEDGSGGFREREEKEEDKNSVGFGKITYTKLLKNQRLKITGVHITHPAFDTKINLNTRGGRFSEWDYGEGGNITINRPVTNPILSNLGLLMYYPLLPLLLRSFLQHGL